MSVDGSKQGLDDFLVNEGKDALEGLIETCPDLIEWAVGVVESAPRMEKRNRLKWFSSRISALGSIEAEMIAKEYKNRLGVGISVLRDLINNSPSWSPSPPRVERERNAEENKEREAENKRQAEAQQRQAGEMEAKALDLLRNPSLLFLLRTVFNLLGLAGEAANSCILYLAITSRLLSRPISVTVKGESSAGKSYVVEKALQLFPANAYIVLTGMSKQALVYRDESFSHKTVVIFERGGMEAADYNIRTLQSEGKIVFETVERDPATNHQQTVRVEKEGPTNFIFTTTAAQIHQENETRHWSIFVDESPEQTEAVMAKIAETYMGGSRIDPDELTVWQLAQTLINPVNVVIPYAGWLAKMIPNTPVRLRRDFTRFLALIEAIALLYQYQREVHETEQTRTVTATLEDYFLAHCLIGDEFIATSKGRNKKVAETIDAMQRVQECKIESGEVDPVVTVSELAKELGKVNSTVSRWLKPALDNRWIEEVSEAKGPKGAEYKIGESMPDPSPLPSVEELAEAFPEMANGFSVVDPITGDRFELEPADAPTRA